MRRDASGEAGFTASHPGPFDRRETNRCRSNWQSIDGAVPFASSEGSSEAETRSRDVRPTLVSRFSTGASRLRSMLLEPNGVSVE
jgi:hypothetical protein